MAVNLTKTQLKTYKVLTEGGEAVIYRYTPGKLLKVYKPHVNFALKRQKVTTFMGLNMPANVYKPEEEVMINSSFGACIMSEIPNAENMHQLIKPAFLKSLGLSNKDVLEIMVEINRSKTSLHHGGTLIGDVSDYNILLKLMKALNGGVEPCFIDVDSWGHRGLFAPDAYTEIFTAPESYQSDGTIKFSVDSENYNFAVLTFNMMTRMHPFNGTYEKDKNMSTVNRMKNRISVLGSEKVIVPSMIPSWKWMSPELLNAFLEIFEKNKRMDITSLLEDQLANMKYCRVHDTFYYGKYSDCPLCSGAAKIITAPVVIKATQAGAPSITIIFEAMDVKMMFSNKHYLATNNDVVHLQTRRRVHLDYGKRIDFSDNGDFTFVSDNSTICVSDKQGKDLGKIERAYQTRYQIIGNDLYYIDNNNNFNKVTITAKGNIMQSISQVYNALFEVAENGEMFVGSFYPKKAIINCNGYNFEFPYSGKVKEYAIKYDSFSKTWLFIYQLPNGKFRTVVFGNKKVEFDSDSIMYNAASLDGICYFNNTIYDPANGKIIGTSYQKNVAKEFACSVVNENARLEFKQGGFIITTDDKIYRYGK